MDSDCILNYDGRSGRWVKWQPFHLQNQCSFTHIMQEQCLASFALLDAAA